jgi:hypothetical protein
MEVKGAPRSTDVTLAQQPFVMNRGDVGIRGVILGLDIAGSFRDFGADCCLTAELPGPPNALN